MYPPSLNYIYPKTALSLVSSQDPTKTNQKNMLSLDCSAQHGCRNLVLTWRIPPCLLSLIMEVKKDEAELEIEGSDMLFKWTDKEWYNFTLRKEAVATSYTSWALKQVVLFCASLDVLDSLPQKETNSCVQRRNMGNWVKNSTKSNLVWFSWDHLKATHKWPQNLGNNYWTIFLLKILENGYHHSGYSTCRCI